MEFLQPYAQYLKYVYLVMMSIFTVSMFMSLIKMRGYSVICTRYDYRPLVLFSVFMIILYGFRPITAWFGDTGSYATHFRIMQDFGTYNLRGDTEATKDVLFYTFMFFSAKIMDVHLFLAICMFFYVYLMFIGCRKLDPKHGALLMLFCYGSFEFYPFAVNGIRNGLACSFLIFALASLCKNDKMLAIVISLVAVGLHKSAILPAAMMFLAYYINKPKCMYIIWIITLILSLTLGGYIDNLLSNVSYDNRLADNLQNNYADDALMQHRFRWDFLLYSSMPIILGWYTIFKRHVYDKSYLVILGTYMYANAFWVLAIRAMFSNRIAYLSWFIYPIVLAYPLLNFPVFKKQHSKKTAWILFAQLCFTLLLWLTEKI